MEDTYDWYAQDRAGNVWYFGEDTTSYDGDEISTEGSWEAGVNGAQAGVVMLARPRVGDGYQQEYDPGNAEDRAEVLSIDDQVVVGDTTYDDVVATVETTPLEPDLAEKKYYAPGARSRARGDAHRWHRARRAHVVRGGLGLTAPAGAPGSGRPRRRARAGPTPAAASPGSAAGRGLRLPAALLRVALRRVALRGYCCGGYCCGGYCCGAGCWYCCCCGGYWPSPYW